MSSPHLLPNDQPPLNLGKCSTNLRLEPERDQIALLKSVIRYEQQAYPLAFGLGDFDVNEGPGKFAFAPHWHFRPDFPLIDVATMDALREGKQLLSVGAGRAHVERLLVSHFGIPREQIWLADIDAERCPPDFGAKQFDMHGRWPEYPAPADIIIFPQCITIGPCFNSEQIERIIHVVGQARTVLSPEGSIRMQVFSEVIDEATDQLHRLYPNLEVERFLPQTSGSIVPSGMLAIR